jgi:hypothetical protein
MTGPGPISTYCRSGSNATPGSMHSGVEQPHGARTVGQSCKRQIPQVEQQSCGIVMSFVCRPSWGARNGTHAGALPIHPGAKCLTLITWPPPTCFGSQSCVGIQTKIGVLTWSTSRAQTKLTKYTSAIDDIRSKIRYTRLGSERLPSARMISSTGCQKRNLTACMVLVAAVSCSAGTATMDGGGRIGKGTRLIGGRSR